MKTVTKLNPYTLFFLFQFALCAQSPFSTHTVALGTASHQTIVTGHFLRGEMADIAVFDRQNDQKTRLRLFKFSQKMWQLAQTKILNHTLHHIDVLTTSRGDVLILSTSRGIRSLDLNNSTETLLFPKSAQFSTREVASLPHLDVTHDLNADGRLDLAVPAKGGFWVATQNAEERFANSVFLEKKPNSASLFGSDGYRYNPLEASKIFTGRFTQDRRSDLAFVKQNTLFIHSQRQNGTFAAEPLRAELAQNITAESRGDLLKNGLEGTALETIADVNGDSIPDLITFTVSGEKKDAFFSGYFGSFRGGELAFSQKADFILKSEADYLFKLDLVNLGSRRALVTTGISRDRLSWSLWKMLKGAMGDDLHLNLAFYTLPQAQLTAASTMRRMALDAPPSHRERGWVSQKLLVAGARHAYRVEDTRWPQALNSTLLFGDINGDNNAELLLSSHPRRLHYSFGKSTGELFGEKLESIKLDMPHDAEFVWLGDLNKDGKQDILLHQKFTERDLHGAAKNPNGGDTQKLTILIAN